MSKRIGFTGVLLLLFIILLIQLLPAKVNTKYNHFYDTEPYDRLVELAENGFFTDEGGYRFDSCIVSEHFEVYYENTGYQIESYAEVTRDILEENYGRLKELLNVENFPVIRVYIYEDTDKLNKGIAASLNRRLTMTVDGYNLYANTMLVTPDCYDFATAIRRCLAWNGQLLLGYTELTPDWLSNGFAAYFSQGSDWYKRYYGDMATGDIPELASMDDYDINQYGYSLIACIVDEYGQEALAGMFACMGDFEKSLGISENEFAEVYRQYLADNRR